MGDLGVVLAASWAILGLSWRPLGPSSAVGHPNRREPQNPSKTSGKSSFFVSWASPGGSLGASRGFLGHLGQSWEALGPSDAFRGRLGRLSGPSWCPLGALLGRLGALLGAFWAISGSSWADLGPSWEPHGLSWRYPGGPSGRLERSETQTSENLKIVQKPKGNRGFLPPRALSEGLLELFWAAWRPLGALRPSSEPLGPS